MKNFFLLIGLIILLGLICSLPLYLTVNLVCIAFHLTFRITLLQALAVSLLLSTIQRLLFRKEKD